MAQALPITDRNPCPACAWCGAKTNPHGRAVVLTNAGHADPVRHGRLCDGCTDEANQIEHDAQEIP